MKSLALHGFAWKLARHVAARRPGTVALAIAMVTASLAFPFLLAILATTAQANLSTAPLSPEAVVFVARGTSGADIAAARDRIQALAGVSSVEWISRDAAWADLGKRTALPTVELKANPLPDVLLVRLAFGTPAAELERVSAEIGKLPRVDSVQSELGWYRRVGQGLDLVKRGAAFGGIAAALMVALILAGAARLLAAAVPEDLRVLALLGAEPHFVRRPFACLGAMVLFCGVILAAGLAAAAAYASAPALGTLAASYGLQWTPAWPPVEWTLAVLCLAVVGGAFVGGLAISQDSGS